MQVTIQYLRNTRRHRAYRYFIFLNSSVRGPFFPSYMPLHWQWTDAFTERLDADTKIVSSSLVCLPSVDAGGHGPKVVDVFLNHIHAFTSGSLGDPVSLVCGMA